MSKLTKYSALNPANVSADKLLCMILLYRIQSKYTWLFSQSDASIKQSHHPGRTFLLVRNFGSGLQGRAIS